MITRNVITQRKKQKAKTRKYAVAGLLLRLPCLVFPKIVVVGWSFRIALLRVFVEFKCVGTPH